MGRNILVVEDDRNICDLIHMYLVKETAARPLRSFRSRFRT